MTKIHFICKKMMGIQKDINNIYTSSMWELSEFEIEKLSDGTVYFHETKSEASYFGGKIIDIFLAPEEYQDSGRKRYIIKLESQLECKQIKWPKTGHTHAMAWYSGVVE